MTSERDRLDAAIDDVAARLVHVDDDAAVAARIVSALPERARLWWWVPQLAALTAFAVAAIVWTTRTAPPPAPVLTASSLRVVAALPNTALAHEPGTPVRTRPLERVERGERGEPIEPPVFLEGDFEGALPPIAPVTALLVSDLDAGDITEPASIDVPSIAIADLTLAAESFSQKEE